MTESPRQTAEDILKEREEAIKFATAAVWNEKSDEDAASGNVKMKRKSINRKPSHVEGVDTDEILKALRADGD